MANFLHGAPVLESGYWQYSCEGYLHVDYMLDVHVRTMYGPYLQPSRPLNPHRCHQHVRHHCEV